MWTDENHEVRQNWDTSCILHQTEALWATTNRNCEQQRKHDKSISCKRYNSSLEKKKTHLNDLLIALVKRFTGVTRNEKKCTQ